MHIICCPFLCSHQGGKGKFQVYRWPMEQINPQNSAEYSPAPRLILREHSILMKIL